MTPSLVCSIDKFLFTNTLSTDGIPDDSLTIVSTTTFFARTHEISLLEKVPSELHVILVSPTLILTSCSSIFQRPIFNKFSFKSFGNGGDVIQTVSITKGVKNYVDAILENSSGTLIEKGKENQVDISWDDRFKELDFKVISDLNMCKAGFRNAEGKIEQKAFVFEQDFIKYISENAYTPYLLPKSAINDNTDHYLIEEHIAAGSGKIRESSRKVRLSQASDSDSLVLIFTGCTSSTIDTYGSAASSTASNTSIIPEYIIGIKF